MRLSLGAALTVVALLAAACSDDPAPGYDEAFRVDFEKACQQGVPGENDVEACACWYERVSTDVPFDELPDIDTLTEATTEEDEVDPDLYGQLADCVRAFGDVVTVPATAPPPPTVPRSTTTTTLLLAE